MGAAFLAVFSVWARVLGLVVDASFGAGSSLGAALALGAAFFASGLAPTFAFLFFVSGR
jgi:hypothetical protein